MRHQFQCPVRWSDLDLQGHVNNVALVDYLQEARVALLSVCADERRPEIGLVVVDNDITFQQPIPYRVEPVNIETWVIQVGAASFWLGYEVFGSERGEREVFARATTRLAAMNLITGMPTKLGAAHRKLLARFYEPALVGFPPLQRAETEFRRARGRHEIMVRFSDVDAYGHVNNIRFFDYIQEARVRYASELWGQFSEQGHPHQYLMFLVRAWCQYRRPMRCRPEPYVSWTGLSQVGRTSYALDTVIEDPEPHGPEEIARARVVMVFVDPATGRPIEPHATVAQAMRSALETEK
jgi:acyl-CoA thioester hydrolase